VLDIVVRPYTVDDAPALHAAILESIEHLRPWMPWIAAEPLTLEERVEWLRGVHDAEGIFVGDTCVGGTGLHDRIGPTGREIGYWVRVGWTGRGIATEAARQLTARAFTIRGIDHVEIHHDKANVASGRVPAKLGYTQIGEFPMERLAPAHTGIAVHWRISA
jgi:RimJ/RimL family protein N-acetyltransferase